MNLQDVANLTIPEGEVKMIHDKNRKLLWGRLSYDTKYKGNTTQITYTGRNLFNTALLSQETDYNTYNSTTGLWTTNDGGSYHRSIFYSAVGSAGNRDVSKIVGPLTANTTYTVKFYDFVNNTSSTSRPLSYAFFHSDNTVIADSQVRVESFFTFTTPAEACYLDIRRLDSGGTFSFSKIMIVKGEYTEETFPSYEPYVGGAPSPSPDYPQAVNVVTGEQSVWVHGKNLADPQTFIDWIGTTYDLCVQYSWGNEDTRPKYGTYQNRNHVARFSGSTLYSVRDSMTNPTYDEARIVYQNMGFKENTQYAVSFDIYSTGSGSQTNLQFLYTDGTTSGISGASQNTWAHCNVKSQSGKTISCIRVTYLTGVVYLDLDTLQIEENSTATTYEPYQGANYTVDLGVTELCKIGNYQDYIYKSGDDWYIHKVTKSKLFNGVNQTISVSQKSNPYVRMYSAIITDMESTSSDGSQTLFYSNNFKAGIWNDNFTQGECITQHNGARRVYFIIYLSRLSDTSTTEATVASFKTWLSTNNVTVYYRLETPTDTKITDNTLIGQLNAVHQFLTRYGYDFDISGNLPIIINQGGLT